MWWFLLLACEEKQEPSTPVEPVVVHDFDAAKPWYPCKNLELDPNAVEVVALNAVSHTIDSRTVVQPVSFPSGSWKQVGLKLQLQCPEDGVCDAWDRTASLRLLDEQGDPTVEVLRYITPYGKKLCAFVDVTDLQARLSGEQSLESFVDTWVGPDSADGHGWRVSATFVFTGPAESSPAVFPLIAREQVVIGDESAPVEEQLGVHTVQIPADASEVYAHLTPTGHGFGFNNNCAEFCELEYVVSVNGQEAVFNPWRKNCDKNPVSDQPGTWEYPRNGWCPGAVAVGKKLDVSSLVSPGEMATVEVSVRRPDGSQYLISGEDGFPTSQISLHFVAK